jgi:hypothetical protein
VATHAQAILARENDPPNGVDGLEWLLLTSELTESSEDLEQLLGWYRLRWRIEVFHKVWKSGAGVERLRMQAANNLLRMTVILAFAAVRLMQLREQFERSPAGPCDLILDTEEWRFLWITVERSKPPKKPPTSGWAYQALGRLGGWTDSKRTGVIGWDTLWSGWSRFQDRLEAVRALRQFTEM